MTVDHPISGRSLSAGLLLFGMFWLSIALMQDFDLAGGAKAIMLLGLGLATVGVTLTVEGRRLPPRRERIVVGGLALVLAVFAALTPSRLSQAETVAVFGLAASPLALRAIGVRNLAGLDRLPAILVAICALLAVNRLRIALDFLHAPDMEDIGRTTIAAVHAVLAGQNPYAAPIDLHPEYPDFPGYKYLPMMMAAYAPLAAALGETGLRLMNLVLDAGVSAAVSLSARRIGGPVAGLLALAAWLMLPVLPRDIYKHGVTDLAPVLPLVFALMLAETRPGRAGLLIGLSVAAKLFPGLLLALCALRRRHIGFYVLGGIAGILSAVAFYLWDPADFTRNVFMFILSRPIDITSWMHGLPSVVPILAKLVYFLFLLAVLIHLLLRPASLARRCGLTVLAVVGALLTGPDAHNNYMIWWAPFFCVLLGALVSAMIAGRDELNGVRA
jgi:hypothetical protein